MEKTIDKITAWREAIFAIIRAKFDEVPVDIEGKIDRKINQFAKRENFLKEMEYFTTFAIMNNTLAEFVEKSYLD